MPELLSERQDRTRNAVWVVVVVVAIILAGVWGTTRIVSDGDSGGLEGFCLAWNQASLTGMVDVSGDPAAAAANAFYTPWADTPDDLRPLVNRVHQAFVEAADGVPMPASARADAVEFDNAVRDRGLCHV